MHPPLLFSFAVPPSVEVGAGQVKGVVGQEAMLNCAVEGTPTPEVTWYRGSVPLAAGGGGALHLSPVSHAAGGVYTCVAVNAVGMAAANVTLIVLGETTVCTAWGTCVRFLHLPLYCYHRNPYGSHTVLRHRDSWCLQYCPMHHHGNPSTNCQLV